MRVTVAELWERGVAVAVADGSLRLSAEDADFVRRRPWVEASNDGAVCHDVLGELFDAAVAAESCARCRVARASTFAAFDDGGAEGEDFFCHGCVDDLVDEIGADVMVTVEDAR